MFDAGGLYQAGAQVFEGFAFDDGDVVHHDFAVGDVIYQRGQAGIGVNAVVARLDVRRLRVEAGIYGQHPVAMDDAALYEFAVEAGEGVAAFDGDDAVAFGDERGVQRFLVLQVEDACRPGDE